MKYYLPFEEKPEKARGLSQTHSLIPSFFAEEAAKFEYHNSGCDADWFPLTVAVIDDQGTEHRFTVDIDWEPEFYAEPL